METIVETITESNTQEVILKGAQILRDGGLVVFPTETVYGIGASLANEEALANIYKAKGRPSNNPLIIHIASTDALKELVSFVNTIEQKLIDAFWPGPLTIIFTKQDWVSSIASGGLDTIAVRFPSHPIACALIKSLGTPIAAPSANSSGRPSATTSADAYTDLNGCVNLILDDGNSSGGLESTVIRVIDDVVHILRPGVITQEDIKEKIGLDVVYAQKATDLHASPGTQYRHYAPDAKLVLCKDSDEIISFAEQERENGQTVGILCTTENKDRYLSYEPHVYVLGSKSNLALISKHIYRGLRFFNASPVTIIFSEIFEEVGLGTAIMDKLTKASQK